MNSVKVLFFATLRDPVGSSRLEMEIPAGMTVKELVETLVFQYPLLEKMKDSMMTAVNRRYAGREEEIPEKAEIAFFPPVSGG